MFSLRNRRRTDLGVIAYLVAWEVLLESLHQGVSIPARVAEFGGLFVLVALVLRPIRSRAAIPAVPTRRPDAVAAPTGGILVFLFIFAVGVPWYVMAFIAPASAGPYNVFALIFALPLLAVNVWWLLLFGLVRLWLTESGIVARPSFAPPSWLVFLPIDDYSTIRMRGKMLWWREPLKRFTGLFLWTSPGRLRERASELKVYEVLDAPRMRKRDSLLDG